MTAKEMLSLELWCGICNRWRAFWHFDERKIGTGRRRWSCRECRRGHEKKRYRRRVATRMMLTGEPEARAS